MLAATCDACSESIADENDRIYCFGGCFQILHTRCAELNSSAAKVLRDNAALKYTCFSCRQQQAGLNEINKKCSDLIQQVDTIKALVSKHDNTLTLLQEELTQSIIDRLLPQLLLCKSNTSAAPTVCPGGEHSRNEKTFAAVLRATSNANNKDANHGRDKNNVPLDEGGLLRSGKRRQPIASCNNAANSLPIISNCVPSTPITKNKSASLIQTEQTVLIKPKQNQAADVTKSDIRTKIDPAPFCVQFVRFVESGEAYIRCVNKESALKLKDCAHKKLSGNYEIEIMKPLRPRLKMTGLSENISAEVLLEKIKKQNNVPTPSDIHIIRLLKREEHLLGAILETDPLTFEFFIRRQHINVGWDRCRVSEEINVLRCYNCSEYGHKASVCKNPSCCPKCSGDHKIRDCTADFMKCANCERLNNGRSNDELVSINHTAWSNSCPILSKRVKLAKQKIDYSS